jgi:hypothetical protein
MPFPCLPAQRDPRVAAIDACLPDEACETILKHGIADVN